MTNYIAYEMACWVGISRDTPVRVKSCILELCQSRKITMKTLGITLLLLAFGLFAFAAEDAVTAVHGTVTKIDKDAKTVTIKTADGAERAFHWSKETSVHGAKSASAAGKESWHGVKEGSEVVAHYTKRGTEDTALEIDKVGDQGLKKTEGTVKEIDRGGKKLVIKTTDGAEHTFKLTGHAAEDAGKDVTAATEKGAKVAVYSTKSAGKAVAHFFEKM